jgi:hypothetical protein
MAAEQYAGRKIVPRSIWASRRDLGGDGRLFSTRFTELFDLEYPIVREVAA